MNFWISVLALLVGIVIGVCVALMFMYNDAVGMHNLYKSLREQHAEFVEVTDEYIKQLEAKNEELQKPGFVVSFGGLAGE